MKSFSAIAVSCVLMGHTDMLSADPPEHLIYLGSYSVYDKAMGLREPSGLSFDHTSGEFWTVSDDSQHIFRIDQAGQVTARLPKLQELVDAEGIATNKTGDFVILSEDARSIFTLTSNADAQAQRYELLDINGADILLAALGGQADRLSPEGLAIERSNDVVFVANERDPRLLIELSPSLDKILSVTRLSADIGFVAKSVDDASLDISGLATDRTRNGLWLSSDTGKAVFFWDRTNKPSQSFELLWLEDGEIRTVKNAEGVALNANNEMLFVITDDGKRSRLHTYRIE